MKSLSSYRVKFAHKKDSPRAAYNEKKTKKLNNLQYRISSNNQDTEKSKIQMQIYWPK